MVGARAVTGLRRGEAPERPRAKPVLEEHIQAIVPFVTPQVQAMIDFQLWSACRPSEAFVMRGIDINMQGPIWQYALTDEQLGFYQREGYVAGIRLSRRATVINVFRNGVKSASDEPLLRGLPVIPSGRALSGQFFPLLFDQK